MNALLFVSALCLMHVYGQPKHCCTPPQWESHNFITEGKAVNSSKYSTLSTEMTSVDQTAQLIAATIDSEVNDTVVPTIKMLQDFKNGKQYVSQNGKCSVSSLPAWTPRCVPDNATLANSVRYGVGSNHIDIDVYQINIQNNVLYLSVTKKDCMPVYQSGYGSKDGVSGISVKTYTNITLGIADRHVFDLPPGC